MLTVRVDAESDVVAARQRARQLASSMGFGNQDQVRIATAVSEIVRNALQYGGGGRIEFRVQSSTRPQSLTFVVSDNGPGIANLDSVLSGRHRSATGMGLGLAGSRRLMDAFSIRSDPASGTVVECSKNLPADAPPVESKIISQIGAHLARESPDDNEVRIQSRDLLETLEALRQREIEIEKRQAEIGRINAELEETNRGVVALYAELDEKAVALRDANELKGKFLRHVSHEFRTPLNSIVALTGLLARGTDGDLTPEQEKQVAYIRQAAMDLTEMVNDLLDLAKVESGKTELHIAPIELSRLLGALRGMMRPIFTNDAVALIIEEPSEPFTFFSDESKIGQVLRNLVSNALKFTERGEVRVHSEIIGGRLAISVTDTGIGIGPEHQERIFQEFAQIPGVLQSRVKGTGLGLPLSRKLAELLGGDLTVESTPGMGSRFTLRLPVAELRAEAKGLSEEPGPILIIDDEEMSRYITTQRFRGTLHRIIEAASGAEGAERARFERPALIFLDLAMPERDGFDVLDDLKSSPETRDIPVFIHTSLRMSASDRERLGNRHRAILAKGDAWPDKVRDDIRSLLGEPDLFTRESVKE